MKRGFIMAGCIGCIGCIVALMGCSSSYSQQGPKLRAKFVKDAASKCRKHGGIPGHSVLTMGEYVTCKKGNNTIFRIQVP